MPLECNKCGKRFASSSPFAIHKCIHTDEILYKCLEWGEAFAAASTLKFLFLFFFSFLSIFEMLFIHFGCTMQLVVY